MGLLYEMVIKKRRSAMILQQQTKMKGRFEPNRLSKPLPRELEQRHVVTLTK